MLTGWQMDAVLSRSSPMAGSGIPSAQSSGSTRLLDGLFIRVQPQFNRLIKT